MTQATATAPSQDVLTAAFLAGYLSAVTTASDLIAFTGQDPEKWMLAATGVLTIAEREIVAQAVAPFIARRDQAVA